MRNVIHGVVNPRRCLRYSPRARWMPYTSAITEESRERGRSTHTARGRAIRLLRFQSSLTHFRSRPSRAHRIDAIAEVTRAIPAALIPSVQGVSRKPDVHLPFTDSRQFLLAATRRRGSSGEREFNCERHVCVCVCVYARATFRELKFDGREAHIFFTEVPADENFPEGINEGATGGRQTPTKISALRQTHIYNAWQHVRWILLVRQASCINASSVPLVTSHSDVLWQSSLRERANSGLALLD